MIFDLTVVGLFLLFRPAGWSKLRNEFFGLKKSVPFIAAFWLCLALPATCAMLSIQKNEVAELGTEFIGADGRKTILLEPEKWVGKDFPLSPFIEPTEVRERLKTGEWTVVLYHHDCPKCRETIEQCELAGQNNVVVVEVPPYGIRHTDFSLYARLTDNLDWFVSSPVVIMLNQYRVLPKN